MKTKLSRREAEAILLEKFGIPHFYDEQWEAIKRLLNGERILMIQRTGYGKSLCYQFPATLFSGVTIVFSPLIALMRDQVQSLEKKGIAAGFINSEQTNEENESVIQRAIKGAIKILYIAPERQENENWIEAVDRIKISMVVIDEAHTISTWGHDFRPAFRRIIDLVKKMPLSLPILAATATANKIVQGDIESQIDGQLTTLRGSLIRENFNLFVVRVKSKEEKMFWLAQYIRQFKGTGLIYTGTRVESEIISKWLQFLDIKAVEYHAGLDAETRKEIEKGLMTNKWKCVVSTNALGMGLDKPDIRFVVHTQIPQSPIHYYQEIGRGGRDGLPTTIVLLFNETVTSDNIFEDVKLPTAFIDNARPPLHKYLRVIELLKEEPLREREIVKKANLKSNQFRVIKADLLAQNIINMVEDGRSKTYEYRWGAPILDTEEFERIRKSRKEDLSKMVEYIYTLQPRMAYLCRFLDSNEGFDFHNCDNSGLKELTLRIEELPSQTEALDNFRATFFPKLETSERTTKSYTDDDGNKVVISVQEKERNKIEIYRNNDLIGKGNTLSNFHFINDEEKELVKALYKKHREKKSHLVDGVASSYYGDSNIGSIIHRCKYENGGDFPDSLLKQTLRAFNSELKGLHFDLIVYIPPTKSGNLVKNFAQKISSILNIPISHNLTKTRETQEQKVFQNNFGKRENIAGAFTFKNGEFIKNSHILLIDDIYDSGATIQEAGRLLSSLGAASITPLVIAKTVGGTL